jgi:hypothetical protein
MRTRVNPKRKGYSESDITDIGRELADWLTGLGAVSLAGEQPPAYGTMVDFKSEFGYAEPVIQRAKLDLMRRGIPIAVKGNRGHYIGQPFEQVACVRENTKRMEGLRQRVNDQVVAIGESVADGAAIREYLSGCLQFGLTKERVAALVKGGDQSSRAERAVQLVLQLPMAAMAGG